MTAVAVKASSRDTRRQAILDIARDVFLAEGYAAASMSAIAARLGGSKGTLYNYFRSKEELFAAFIGNEVEFEAVAAFAVESEAADLPATLHGLGLRVVNFLTSDKVLAIHRLVIAEAERFPELGRKIFEVGPKRRVASLAAFFEHAMETGQLKRADPRRAAEHFLALCRSGVHDRRLWNLVEKPTAADIRANVDAALDVFMAAYAPTNEIGALLDG